MISFIYSNDEEMMQAQVHFIELGKHALKFSDYINDLFKETYFKILDALLKRGELDLAQLKIGFYENFSGSTAKKIEK